MHSAALTGFAGGKLNGQADVCLVVPSQNMMQIEDVFAVMGSALTAALSQPQINSNVVMDAYLNASAEMIANLPAAELQEAAELLHRAQLERQRTFCLADGAGIFFATHMVNDLIKATLRPELPRMQAICLADNESAMTAFANDVGSHAVFAEPLRSLAQPGDLALFYVLDGADAGLAGAAQAVGELGMQHCAGRWATR
jgi:phosphoheptose isomerase